MVINSLKAVFFIGGGAVVAAGAAYVTGALDIFFPDKETAIASLPSPEVAPSAPAAKPAPAVTPAPDAAAPKMEQPAAPAAEEAAKPQEAAPGLIVPTFDIVRVEPDGSLVIAGRAAPVASVEIVSGAKSIGMGEANASGEFAIVLDDPLKPGDYTLVLRSTTRDAIVATSEETAIVSVPDNAQGQVLALVEQPGAPSRLITVPDAAAPKQDRAAAPAPQAPAAGDGQMAAAPAQPGQPAAGTAGTEAPAQTAQTTETPQAAPAQEAAAATPAQPEAPAANAEQQAAVQQPAETASQAAPQAQQPAETAQPQQMAAAQPQQPAQAQAPAEKSRIAVEAVEIEGSRVFVAGRAEAGARVRVYANDILLGDAQTSDGGRFLVEAERELPVGDYIVRADLLGRNAEVVARAAVPFEREPGEAVAAVAAPEPQSMVQQPSAQAPQAAAQPQPDAGKPAETAAATQPQTPAQQPAAGTAGQQVAAAPATAPAAGDPAGQPAAPQAAGQPTVQQPAGQQLAGQQTASAPAAGGEVATQPEASAAGQAVTAPKLQNVAGAVIIRRGDTLWRISKRVYGRGVRYTTIYLANQEQIEDPDRIWPGQVFSVPDKTDSGENADMSAVADRVPGTQAETR